MTDSELQQLRDEEAALARRQAEVKRKLLALNAGSIPERPRSVPPSVTASDACTASESEDDVGGEDGDLGLGLGHVVCPKTGKAA